MLIDLRLAIVADADKYRHLSEPLRTILIHRIALGNRARDVVAAFTGGVPDAAAVTGYKMPYHFVVEGDGTVVQCLPLSRQGPHAWKRNVDSIGVAAIGDFTRHAPAAAQWRSAAILCHLLGKPQAWEILGHDEAPQGSRDPNKQCPGWFWDMDRFREGVHELLISGGNVDDFWRYVAV